MHVVFHGCSQSKNDVGDAVTHETGFADWAETNNIIMLFPQAAPSTLNPKDLLGLVGLHGPELLHAGCAADQSGGRNDQGAREKPPISQPLSWHEASPTMQRHIDEDSASSSSHTCDHEEDLREGLKLLNFRFRSKWTSAQQFELSGQAKIKAQADAMAGN